MPLTLVTLVRLVAVVLLAGAAGAASAAESIQPPSMFSPVSTPAAEILELSWLVIGITGAIFVVVETLLLVGIVRYRRGRKDDGREPAQVYASGPIEMAWTIVPIIIVAVLFLVTTRSIATLQKDSAPPGWLDVTLVGHQWWWEFRYPEYGITTANELHVPTSGPGGGRPTFLTLHSADVIHSFWIPQLAGKTDVIPNRENHMWIEPRESGLFVGQCAEYCGTQHANMLIRVIAHPPEEFEAWVQSQQQDAVDDPEVRAGRNRFLSTACVNCHRVTGTRADGSFGPDLTHLMSRATIGAGIVANNRENLIAWVKDPDHFKPGALMPAMGLGDPEVERVADYLLTLQ
ncbi:MAG: cytochrome c oxidase subunit II [Myxococcales bacterium]|nr:cytochrome c oxidase subunit II [Myxococcales bacterium]